MRRPKSADAKALIPRALVIGNYVAAALISNGDALHV